MCFSYTFRYPPSGLYVGLYSNISIQSISVVEDCFNISKRKARHEAKVDDTDIKMRAKRKAILHAHILLLYVKMGMAELVKEDMI